MVYCGLKKAGNHKNNKSLNPQSTADAVRLLKTCARVKDLCTGARVHADILKKDLLGENPFVASAIVNMYAKCGALLEAKDVLEGLPVRSVVAWNALIGGYVHKQHDKEALCCFEEMWHDGFHPDAVTYACILKVCGNIGALEYGEYVHVEINRHRLLPGDVVLGNALVDMYAKCGALAKAKEVLEGLCDRDVISWSTLIAGYIQKEQGMEALKCFEQMQCEGIQPDSVTFTFILKACGNIGALEKGAEIHYEIIKQGLLEGDDILGNALVDVYARCGALAKGKEVLDELPVRNVVSWSVLIAGYVQREHGKEALNTFEQMQLEGISPDGVTFSCILKACSSLETLPKGKEIHTEIVRRGLLGEDDILGGALVDMYANCGALEKANEVFESLPSRLLVSWSAMIAAYAEGDQSNDALNCFQCMHHEGLLPDTFAFSCCLKACGILRAVDMGKQVHSEIVRRGLLDDSMVLGNALIDMYVRCGAFSEAKEVLEKLLFWDVVSWNVLIAGYVQGEHIGQALICFEQMQSMNIFPDVFTLMHLLEACSNIGAPDIGQKIHSEIVGQGCFADNAMLGDAVLDNHVRCRACFEAEEVLEQLCSCHLASWNALIKRYKEQHAVIAFSHFKQVQCECISPDPLIFACMLKACGMIGSLKMVEEVHDEIVRLGLLGINAIIDKTLVDMYAKYGALARAKSVFEELPVRDVVLWNTLIAGYVVQNYLREAMICFEEMQYEGLFPNAITYTFHLKVYGILGALDKGENLLPEIVMHGFLQRDVALGSALMHVYAKCGALRKAMDLFDGLPFRDVVSWNAITAGYVQRDKPKEAVDCFQGMLQEGVCPDQVTLGCVLKACGSMEALDQGGDIHSIIVRQGLLEQNIPLGNALVSMYARCGAFTKAEEVLEELFIQDVVSWNALITGYVLGDHCATALKCLEGMQYVGISPDAVTFCCTLKACGSMGALEKGSEIHAEIVRQGFLCNNIILSNALVDMYAKCGAFSNAEELLERDLAPNVICWSALIAGYVHEEHGKEALNCFQRMQHRGLSPNAVTFACALKACSIVAALENGEKIHSEIVQQRLLVGNVVLGNVLMDMYVKCGALCKAKEVLMGLPVRNVVSWNSLIAGYAQEKLGKEVVKCFEQMQLEGLLPNGITFLCLLSACGHSGLLDDAKKLFRNMTSMYGVVYDLEHHACMVHLFAHMGLLNKAIEVIKDIPNSNYPAMWFALLSGCKQWGNDQIGMWAFQHAVELDMKTAIPFVHITHIYPAADIKGEALEVQALRTMNEAL